MTNEIARTLLIQIFNTYSNIITANYKDGVIQEAFEMAIEALRKTEPSDSEKPNNCEHITEDGVTCAKYPACDGCLDNPLSKVKGSERLVKGSEQTDCQTCKRWSSYGYCVYRECKGYEPQGYCDDCLYTDTCDSKEFFYACTSKATCSKMERVDKDTNVRSKPNDCKYAVNPSGDVWECGCCLEIFCEHQIYDRNPDGTLNIVECGFEPKTEPQTCANGCKWLNQDGECTEPSGECHIEYRTEVDEPQTDCETCRYAGECDWEPWQECPYAPKDEPQTERSDMSEIDKMIKMVDGILGDDDLCEGCEYVIEGLSCAECRRKYADKIIKILRDMKHKPQTDCAWGKGGR